MKLHGFSAPALTFIHQDHFPALEPFLTYPSQIFWPPEDSQDEPGTDAQGTPMNERALTFSMGGISCFIQSHLEHGPVFLLKKLRTDPKDDKGPLEII